MLSVHTLNPNDEGIFLNGNSSASAVIEETTRKREMRLLKNRYCIWCLYTYRVRQKKLPNF